MWWTQGFLGEEPVCPPEKRRTGTFETHNALTISCRFGLWWREEDAATITLSVRNLRLLRRLARLDITSSFRIKPSCGVEIVSLKWFALGIMGRSHISFRWESLQWKMRRNYDEWEVIRMWESLRSNEETCGWTCEFLSFSRPNCESG
jgi:hypothetical protein